MYTYMCVYVALPAISVSLFDKPTSATAMYMRGESAKRKIILIIIIIIIIFVDNCG